MGIDQTVYATQTGIPEYAFEKPTDAIEIFYWRKNYAIHEWMTQLYFLKSGNSERSTFSNTSLKIDPIDIDRLLLNLNHNSRTMSEFDVENRAEFISIARQAFRDGNNVFYLTSM